MYEALPDKGKVLLFDPLQNDERNGPDYAVLFPAYYLTIASGGGNFHSWATYEQWLPACPSHTVCTSASNDMVIDTGAAAPTTRGRVWLLVALVLVTLNLRPAMSAVAALLAALRTGLVLSGPSASVLITLPTVGLAVFAFLGPRPTGRWGEERLIAGSAFLLLAGNLLRIPAAATALFAGTVLIGAAIGLINGAVPGLVKRDYPDHFAALMALYTGTLTVGAAGASGLATPLGEALGVWVTAVVLGLGQGGGFGLAMTLIGLRARDASAATGLSGMAQGIGYTFSAAGLLCTGLLHSATGNWTAPLVLLVLVCLVQLGMALGAGQDKLAMH